MSEDAHREFLESLYRCVGEQGLLVGEEEMGGYLSDWRGAWRGGAVAVVRPANSDEIADVVRYCAAAGIGIVPQGGNTGLSGGAVPAPAAGKAAQIVLSLSRMRAIRAVDPVENTITVEAGAILQEVQDVAAKAGRLFPVSLGSEGSCTIGGNLSTNAGGTAVLRYGMIRHLTLGLEVVLPDGRIWNGLRPLRKDNTGYDIKQTFIGAEGTLGIITVAVLALSPQVPETGTAWLGLRDPAKGTRVLEIVRSCIGDVLTAAELMSRTALDMVFDHVSGTADPLDEPTEWSLLLEAAGPRGSDVDAMLEKALDAVAEEDLITNAAIAIGDGQRGKLWVLRESISEAQNHEGPSLKHDITLPVTALVDFITVISARLEGLCPGIRLVTYGHIGDGNLHYNLSKPANLEDSEFVERAEELSAVVYEEVKAYGGSISAEHGIGLAKRDALRLAKDPVELDLMRKVKSALDPAGLMNPGKVL